MENQKMIKALKDLEKAFYAVNLAWEKCDIDELGINGGYPFEMSFDELAAEVGVWVDELTEELEEINELED